MMRLIEKIRELFNQWRDLQDLADDDSLSNIIDKRTICAVCGKEVNTLRGFRIHSTRVHGK